jgi:glucose/arabinose dehydrogenase
MGDGGGGNFADAGDDGGSSGLPPTYTRQACALVPLGQADGTTPTMTPTVEMVVNGLQIPWGLAWLPNGDLLITERPGRLRLVKAGQLLPTPVITIDVAQIPAQLESDALGTEGGLLGVALHPAFATNHMFYMYWEAGTPTSDGGLTLFNRLGMFKLSDDGTSAMLDHIMIDNIPGGTHHQGGRLAIGPDGKLYVPIGAYDPTLAQMPDQLPGKVLRLNPDGSTPSDNPTPGSPVFLTGIRNTEGFDWFNRYYLLMAVHGPTLIDPGVALKGYDQFIVARAGENLGWPLVVGCNTPPSVTAPPPPMGLTQPVLSWEKSTPPGGGVIYRGDKIPQWTGSFMMATLGLEYGAVTQDEGKELIRIQVDPNNPYTIKTREVYLKGQYGRLRTVANGPDGYLYLTTSNCDSRGMPNGRCAMGGDQLLRVTGLN